MEGTTVKHNRAEAESRGEERFERTIWNRGTKPQRPLHGRVAEAGQRSQQRVAGHGASVIVSTFVFVPGVSNAAIITAAQSLNDGQALSHETLRNEMRCHLVFNAGPDFIGIYK